MIARLGLLAALLLLAGCGGGGGSTPTSTTTSSSSGTSTGTTTTTTTTTPTNLVTLTVDSGPAGLDYVQDNVGYVTITLCPPGSATNCQTIDHIAVDTGSSGLRVLASSLNASLLAAMPQETDTSGNPVGECLVFVDGYVFGSVRTADFTIGGEKVASLALQVIGDSGPFQTVPSNCSSGGGTNQGTFQNFGANGLLGVGPEATDCGSLCATDAGSGAAIYYDCPSAGCGSIIARSASTTAPFQQLPNPVAAFAVDNNGVIISLPSAPANGEATLTGTLYFGIGTQTNNALGSATVFTTTTSASRLGTGFISVAFNGQTLDESYIDSGTTVYVFSDSSLQACSNSEYSGLYCPASPTSLTAEVIGQNAASEIVDFTIANAETLLSNSYAVLPDLGGNPDLFSGDEIPSSFAFGLPFFYGRTVYTAIEGRTAGGVSGPYFAF